MRRAFVDVCARWWSLHAEPQPEGCRGNIGIRGWRAANTD